MDRGAWGLQSVGSHRVRHDCRALAHTHTRDTISLLWSKRGHHLLKCPWRGSAEALSGTEDGAHPRQGGLRRGGGQRSPTATPGSSQNSARGNGRPQGRRKPEKHTLCPPTLCQRSSAPVRPPPRGKGGAGGARPPQEEQNRDSLPELRLGPSSAPQGAKVSAKDTGTLASPHLRASAEHPYSGPGKGDAQKVIFL